jgi:hypothetical protein
LFLIVIMILILIPLLMARRCNGKRIKITSRIMIKNRRVNGRNGRTRQERPTGLDSHYRGPAGQTLAGERIIWFVILILILIVIVIVISRFRQRAEDLSVALQWDAATIMIRTGLRQS